jgi:hypothetical protein
MLNRFIAAALVVGAAGFASVVACGSSSPKNNPDADKNKEDAAKTDAPGSGSNPGGSNALGASCTGTCPSGFTCLQAQGDPAFCSQPCDQNNDTCDVGFDGPGIGACILNVTMGSGSGSAETFCGIICGGSACEGSSACTGQCPATLDCNLPLQNQSGSDVGSACS